MVTAEEFGRSLRGAAAILNRDPRALASFEMSQEAFWRSFAAIGLTAPAYVVELGLLRRATGRAPGAGLFDPLSLALLAGVGHVAAFLALPVAVALLSRRLGLGQRYAAFVIVTNWIAAFASYALAIPGALLLLHLEPPALTRLFELAFAAVVVVLQWRATGATLGTDRSLSAAVTGLGILLSTGIAATVQALATGMSG